MKNTGLKKFASAIMAVTMLVFPVIARAGYAPQRPTYTYGPDFTGADKVVFNSIVNNPGYGDERTFFDGRPSTVTSGGWSDPINNVQAGKEYKLRIFVHNNANQGLNASGKGVAVDTKVKVALPTQTAKDLVATAAISASNATPQTVTDTLNFKSTSDVKLSYVPGSAYINTKNVNNVKLSDSIVTTGATVGSDAVNGKWAGCFDDAGWVYLTVKATAPVVPPVVPPVTPPVTPPTTPTLPETGAEGAAAAALGLTAMGTGVQAYLRSKRGLVKAQRKISR